MKPFKHFIKHYQIDHAKASKLLNDLDKRTRFWMTFSTVLIIILLILPFILLGLNLFIFIELQKAIVIIFIHVFGFLPLIYFMRYYHTFRVYTKDISYVTINRLIWIDGLSLSILFLILAWGFFLFIGGFSLWQ